LPISPVTNTPAPNARRETLFVMSPPLSPTPRQFKANFVPRAI
jgi:hypothetical protein